MKLNFQNTFARLPESFFKKNEPTPVIQPSIIAVNDGLAEELGIDPDFLRSDEGLAFLSGNSIPEGAEPLAMAYAGHQFGGFSPKLGDGRAILMGEIGGKDIQLKGAGPTSFSRRGDGRSALGPVLREYLVSEAMHALGIPTTRALAAVMSGELVLREQPEKGGILTRVASSHLRIGTAQYFAARDDTESLKALVEYAIQRHNLQASTAFELFQDVIRKQAQLVAQWMGHGFIHGVMNTDNMSILGETFDYGPYGFMEDYLPSYVCNHSDHQGRYAFKNQPYIGLWNCSALGHALSSLISEEAQGKILQTYEEIFQSTLAELFRKKLGLEQEQSEDATLIQGLLDIMESEKLDYTNTFRNLTQALTNKITPELNSDIAKSWIVSFQERHTKEGLSVDKKVISMKQVNPKFILRNYMAQEAIDAAEESDFSMLETLIIILTKPFEEHKEYQNFANKSPAWAKDLEISCSS